jgi:hypothetical protein
MFGWFKKKPPAPEPAPPPPPGPGRIESFSAVDSVGEVKLDSGPSVRFGASACRGFLPVVGLRVEVLEVSPHPLGGFRASALTLPASERARADAALDALRPLKDDHAGAAVFGVLTVLLRERLDATSRGAVRAFFEKLDLPSLGAQLNEGDLRSVQQGGTQVSFVLGSTPFPATGLDFRHAEGCALGQSFITFNGVVPALTASLIDDGTTPDLWKPGGSLRLITTLSRRAIEAGLATGVVIHRAGEVVRTGEQWARTTEPSELEAHRTFLPWLDLGITNGVLRSYGMEALWLPDVEVVVAHPGLDEDEAYDRAHEVVQFACHQLVHRKTSLRVNDRLRVPIAAQIGPGPLDELNAELSATPTVEYGVEVGERRRLVPLGPVPTLASLWKKADQTNTPLAYPVYRQMVISRVRLPLIGALDGELVPGVPHHEVLVFKRTDGRFLSLTCGIAREPQRGGEDANDDRRIEFCFVLPAHSPVLCKLLSRMASLVHGRDVDAPPLGPEHRIALPLELGRLRMGSMITSWRNQLDFGEGPKVSLYGPLALTPEETRTISSEAKVEWLHGPGSAPEVMERWMLAVPDGQLFR